MRERLRATPLDRTVMEMIEDLGVAASRRQRHRRQAEDGSPGRHRKNRRRRRRRARCSPTWGSGTRLTRVMECHQHLSPRLLCWTLQRWKIIPPQRIVWSILSSWWQEPHEHSQEPTPGRRVRTDHWHRSVANKPGVTRSLNFYGNAPERSWWTSQGTVSHTLRTRRWTRGKRPCAATSRARRAAACPLRRRPAEPQTSRPDFSSGSTAKPRSRCTS